MDNSQTKVKNVFKLSWLKLILLIGICTLIGYSIGVIKYTIIMPIPLPVCPPPPCPSPLPPDQGVIIDPNTLLVLTRQFSDHLPSNERIAGSIGGRIGRSALQCILNQMPTSQTYINFRFGRDNSTPIPPPEPPLAPGSQYLILSAGNLTTPQPTDLIIRSSNQADCFCPSRCN